MFAKIFKTAKFVSGWYSWTLLYPLVATKAGRERLARMTAKVSRMYPDKVHALRKEVDQLMTLLVTGPSGMAPDVPEPAIVVEEAPAPETKPPASPRSRGSISELKTRLGIKKS